MRPELAPELFCAGMAQQLARFSSALAQGMPRRGWKVGINVPEIQARLALPHAGVGWLDGEWILASGDRLEPSARSRLHVEAELALVIGTSLDGSTSVDTARRAISRVHAALEIVDYSLPAKDLGEVIGHSMFHRATVLGAPVTLDQARELGTRWPVLRVGSRAATPKRADLVPGDLGELVSFVAAYLKAFGAGLEAGDLILSGSYLPALPIAPGEDAHADFGALGAVSLTVAPRLDP